MSRLNIYLFAFRNAGKDIRINIYLIKIILSHNDIGIDRMITLANFMDCVSLDEPFQPEKSWV